PSGHSGGATATPLCGKRCGPADPSAPHASLRQAPTRCAAVGVDDAGVEALTATGAADCFGADADCGVCIPLSLRCMSTLPRKCAPSAIATRGEMMSPSTDPLSRMSTFSVAVTLPLTWPRTMTALANTCALILPLGPIVSTCSCRRMVPSTC